MAKIEHPDDMVPGITYWFCQINIPNMVFDRTIWETREERDIHAKKLEDKYNILYNGKTITTKAGVNRGNCVSGFIAKWRIMREVKNYDQETKEDTVSEKLPDGVCSLKERG